MKTTLLICACLAVLASTAHAQSPAPADPQLVQSLADRPMGLAIGDTCHVRGAVWAYGPRPDVKVLLVDVVSAQGYTATTDANGTYALAIPYSEPAVYQERLADPVFVRQGLEDQVRVLEGGVVCDHRLSVQLTHRQEANQ